MILQPIATVLVYVCYGNCCCRLFGLSPADIHHEILASRCVLVCVCETKINSAYGHNKTTSILYREVSSVKGFKLKLSALVDECVVKTWMSL